MTGVQTCVLPIYSEVDYNTIRDIIIDQLSILPELPAFNSVNEFKNTINTILE